MNLLRKILEFMSPSARSLEIRNKLFAELASALPRLREFVGDMADYQKKGIAMSDASEAAKAVMAKRFQDFKSSPTQEALDALIDSASRAQAATMVTHLFVEVATLAQQQAPIVLFDAKHPGAVDELRPLLAKGVEICSRRHSEVLEVETRRIETSRATLEAEGIEAPPESPGDSPLVREWGGRKARFEKLSERLEKRAAATQVREILELVESLFR